MINLNELTIDLKECEKLLDDFKNLLDTNDEISEGKADGLLKFFQSRPQLIILIGKWRFAMDAKFYKPELNLFNEFRADFAVCDSKKKNFLFIEFEDARKNSVFSEITNEGTTRYEWASRFEHGFSQVLDWFYRLDDYSRTNKMEEYFGHSKIEYSGLLVIGRDKFIKEAGCESRLSWRKEKLMINNNPVHCITFDQLYLELEEKLFTIQADLAGYL